MLVQRSWNNDTNPGKLTNFWKKINTHSDDRYVPYIHRAYIANKCVCDFSKLLRFIFYFIFLCTYALIFFVILQFSKYFFLFFVQISIDILCVFIFTMFETKQKWNHPKTHDKLFVCDCGVTWLLDCVETCSSHFVASDFNARTLTVKSRKQVNFVLCFFFLGNTIAFLFQ